MKKRFIMIILACCMLISSANALNVNTGEDDTYIVSVDEQIDAIMASDLTAEQKDSTIQKLLYGYSNLSISPQSAFNVQPNILSGYRVSKQIYRNYCVAATCQAIQIYLGGGAPGQEYIGKELGLTPNGDGANISRALNYLNTVQDANYYVRRYVLSLDDFCNDVSASISIENPVYISTEFSEDDGWAYSTSGHAMSIYGIDYGTMNIADPYIQWVDKNASLMYSMSSETVHEAICNRGSGYLF